MYDNATNNITLHAAIDTHHAWRVIVNGAELCTNSTVRLSIRNTCILIIKDEYDIALSGELDGNIAIYDELPNSDGRDSICFTLAAGCQPLRVTIEPEAVNVTATYNGRPAMRFRRKRRGTNTDHRRQP